MVTPASFIQERKQISVFLLCQNNLLKADLRAPIEQHQEWVSEKPATQHRSVWFSADHGQQSQPEWAQIPTSIITYNCLSLNKLSNLSVPISHLQNGHMTT